MLDNSSARTARAPSQRAGANASPPHVIKVADGRPASALAELRSVAAEALELRRLDPEALHALRALDGRALPLLEAMLSEYAAIGAHVQSQDRRLARPALDMCTALGQTFEHAIRMAGEGKGIERFPDLVVRLLRYRDIELAFTLCQFDTWQRARWRSLHDAYRLARDRGIAAKQFVIGERDGETVTVSAEEVYLRTLLLEVAGSGQLLPVELMAARRFIARKANCVSLRPAMARGAEARGGFWLDGNNAAGLSRTPVETEGALWLDSSPLASVIETELESPRTSDDAVAGRRSVLLSRLAAIYAPTATPVRRRGERHDEGRPVEVAFGGLQGIYRMLRDEARHRAERTTVVPEVDEIVIGAVGEMPHPRRAPSLPVDAPDDGSTNTFEAMTAAGPAWQVRDSSDSGCRLRGRATELRHLLPGSLMAFREDGDAPWRLAVVRRLRKILGTNVELGVERLAVGPQRVVLVDPRAPRGENGKPARTIAFYLPESPACPRIPVKTLVVPANEFEPGRALIMAGARDLTIRMKEPLEQQADFVWATFEFADDARP